MSALPFVLEDYLHTLIDNAPAIRAIVLVPNTLGWSDVQDIYLLTDTNAIHHRVFGFPPVQARLNIRRISNRCELIPAA